jgi:WD40 repeat protein/serine/threonine protein kinase
MMIPKMVRDYRCECGHAWAAVSGDPCPACGTMSVATDPTPNNSDHTHVLGPVSNPSFSSLADEKTDPDPFAVTRDLFAVQEDADVPIGVTQEFRSQPVPGYEIHEELGRGGMGVVYRAVQTALNRPVALKMILAGSHAGAVERERFRREAQAVASLQHPNIVQIFEIGDASGHPYLALELVEGGSLAQQLVGNPWGARDAAELVELLSRAVHYAHTQGVVHRDLKPGNILLAKTKSLPAAFHSARNAIPKVTDFGLAKRIDETVAPDGATKTGAVMGTPSYIAPEQASGKTREIGPPADVYALGAILYELLTGRPPFRGETPLDTVLQVINEDPVSPKSLQSNVPWDLQTICLKCLMKSPAKRYPSALALAEDLRRYLNGEAIQARPLSSWGRSVKWARRHPALAVLGIGTVAATIAVLSVLSVAYARVREAVLDKENEATAAHRAREDEVRQRKLAQALAAENERARIAAVEQANQLKRESERNRRGAYALQIAQIAALAEREPKRAQTLLEDPGRCPPDLRDFAWDYLHRLCYREDRVYRDHPKGEELECIAVSHGGTFVATAGASGEIRIWDPRNTRTYASLTGHKGRIHGLAFSPDGGMLASASADGTVRLWGFPEDMLEMARRTMGTLAFLSDFVKPFQLRAIAVIPTGKGVSATCLAFSPDGRVLAAGYSNGMVVQWNYDSMRANNLDIAAIGGLGAVGLWKFRQPQHPALSSTGSGGNGSPVRCLAFSDSSRFLAAGHQDSTVRVRIAVQGRLSAPDYKSVSRNLDSHGGPVEALAFSPDEKSLFTVNNGAVPSIREFETQSWREERRFLGHSESILSLAVSPDGTRLASGGADDTVRLWDLEEGREIATLTGHNSDVKGIAFGGDRRSVISVGSDGLARVWNTSSRANDRGETVSRDVQLATLSHDAHAVIFASVDSNGRLAVRMADVVAGRYQPQAGTLNFWFIPVRVPPSANIRTAAVAPDGRAVYAGTDDAILMWRMIQLRGKGRDPTAVSLPIMTPVVIPVPKPIRAMMANPDGTRLATLHDDGIRIWKTFDFPFAPEAKRTVPIPDPIVKDGNVAAMAFHPNGDLLAVALDTGMRIVDLDGNAKAELPLLHAAPVAALAFDAEGTQLATASADGFIKVWRVGQDLALVHQTEMAAHTGAVSSVSFTPGGRTLASGGVDRQVVLWDPVTGQERLTLGGHVDRLVEAQFTENGKFLITAGRDGAVRRWRADQPPTQGPTRPPFLPGPPMPPQRAKK